MIASEVVSNDDTLAASSRAVLTTCTHGWSELMEALPEAARHHEQQQQQHSIWCSEHRPVTPSMLGSVHEQLAGSKRTFKGSMMPALTRSSYSPVAAL